MLRYAHDENSPIDIPANTAAQPYSIPYGRKNSRSVRMDINFTICSRISDDAGGRILRCA